MSEAIWWLIVIRGVLAVVFAMMGARLVSIAYQDRAYNRDHRLNGMCEVLTTGQIRTGTVLTLILTACAISTYFSWRGWEPYRPYRGIHLSSSIFFGLAVLGLGYNVLRDLIDHQTVVPMARDAMQQKDKTVSK